jgi:hypothetical protein
MAVRDVVQAAAGVGGGGEYVEDVFSTYLYAGNGSTQTIENGIDLDGEGGLVWIKGRDDGAHPHCLYDTERGVTKLLSTNYNSLETVTSSSLTQDFVSFNSNGFSLGEPWNTGNLNSTAMTKITSWSFRKSPKFFDVVTWTGDGNAGRTIAHNLGSVPGCIIVKSTSNSTNWVTYHRSTGASQSLYLNRTDEAAGNDGWNYTAPTSTEFTVGSYITNNASGYTYVAYLFAHDAGGFGDDGEQNVISCGSYVGAGSSASTTVNLGYEPQWVLVKPATTTGPWSLIDNMRGWTADSSGDKWFEANTSGAEFSSAMLDLNATGFTTRANYSSTNSVGQTYIYIAIRRGPMKVPTDGTSVFSPNVGGATTITTNFPVDLSINTGRNSAGRFVMDRLRGSRTNFFNYLETNSTAAETQGTGAGLGFDNNTAFVNSSWSGTNWVWWSFGRAPGFFDVVAYTGNGSATHNINHNLTVSPEMMIVKRRNSASNGDWYVYHKDKGYDLFAFLNDGSVGVFGSTTIYNAEPTSTVFTVGSNDGVNASGSTYIWYGFATTAGVSKVGSYTGTGSNVNVDCGFSAGARFILIKRSNDGVGGAGDWYVWDSVRGIVAGNDPYLFLNSTAAEEPNTDYIDPLASGFTVTSAAPAALNASGGSYIFLAIA